MSNTHKAHVEEIHGSLKLIAALQAAQLGWTLFSVCLFILWARDWITAVHFVKKERQDEK